MSEQTANDEVECPKCGHVHSESHEWFSGSEDRATCTCDECGAELEVFRDWSVTYYTNLKEAKP